jgi:hypothetical protein
VAGGPTVDRVQRDAPTRFPPAAARRSSADRTARRLLRLPEDAPPASLVGAEGAFSKSLALSGTRCLLTYVVIPVLGPALGLTGAVGPALGLALGAVSIVAIVAATRRFFAADHRWRWAYAAIGGAILVLLLVQTVVDLVDVAGG